MFKFILLVASLAYVSAGHADSGHGYAPASAVSYSTVTRTHALPSVHGNDHSVLHHGYTHPHNNHHVYGHNFAPAHSYEQDYAQYVSSHDNYGHARYGARLAVKHAPVVVAHVPEHHHHNTHGAPVLVANAHNYGGVHHHSGYDQHHHHQGHYAY
ncbi:hypothetical protein RP20_CCG020489 [Aedes albopictus]|nr:hypothetical protein RP20_CCG020489 [Aedes albopictus]